MEARDYEYVVNGKKHRGYIAYKADRVQRPVVLLLPEWWGMTDHIKARARETAALGYFVFVVDIYGRGIQADNPTDAGKLASPFHKSVTLGKTAFDMARTELENFDEADISRQAVTGYCFGGGIALNMARLEGDLKGAVCFHGVLMGGAEPNNNRVKILVLNGEADTFITEEEITAFKKQMEEAKIAYEFINYPNAVHSFTNPSSTADGKKYNMNIAYNEKADKGSWRAMKRFLREVLEE